MIYLDNNATTIMPPIVKKELVKWCNRGNPSAGYRSAIESRMMMDNMRTTIQKHLGVTDYRVIFTSGASESNATIINAVSRAYHEVTGAQPHIIMSEIEHKSLLLAAKNCEVSFVKPVRGVIRADDIKDLIKSNTALICVMAANNETGAIMDLVAIGKLAHEHNIPFHSDCVQAFGKVRLDYSHCDSLSLSFHKIHGPPGCGALLIKEKFLVGWNLQGMIFGTQEHGMRGGTENIIGIGASYAAIKYTFTGFSEKVVRMKEMRTTLINLLKKQVPVVNYYDNVVVKEKLHIVLFDSEVGLPNTVLFSMIWKGKTMICNGKIKDKLEKKSIIVSVGSACNTASTSASHVLHALGADLLTRKGTLRISMGDETTIAEINTFVKELFEILKKECR